MRAILAYKLWSRMHKKFGSAWRIAGDKKRAIRYLEHGY